MYLIYNLAYLFFQNKDAILSLPQEVKIVVVLGIGAMFITSFLSRLKELFGFAVVLFLAYFACTYFGIL